MLDSAETDPLDRIHARRNREALPSRGLALDDRASGKHAGRGKEERASEPDNDLLHPLTSLDAHASDTTPTGSARVLVRTRRSRTV